MNDTADNKKDLNRWEKYLAGDQHAIKELYTKLFGKLFNSSYYLTGNKEQAEDMVQEAFRKLIEQKPGGLYDLEGWLKKAIVYQWRTQYRNTSNRRDHLENYKEKRLTESYQKNSLYLEKLYQVIDITLNQTNAKIIHMASKGYKNAEIAEELGLTERQVRNRKLESKKKLKKIIGGDKS